MAAERAPWWKWTLFSLGLCLVEVAFMLGGMVVVLFRGVDVRDYIYLGRPPFITDGFVAAGFALLLAGQTVAPLVVIPVFRPARIAAFSGFRRPAPGIWRRLAVGVLLLAFLQIVWSYGGPAPAEQWRMVDHLTYAVAGGGRFWPIAWMFLTVVLLAPLAEEVMFRGLAFGILRRRWGFWIGAAATAVVFGLAHGFADALPAAVMGFYFAYQVEQDGSLLGSLALHGLNNLAAVLMTFVPVFVR